MARWQRQDYLYRHMKEAKQRAEEARKGLSGLMGAVLARVLGL